MRRLVCAVLFLFALTGAAFAMTSDFVPGTTPPNCSELRMSEQERLSPPVQLANSCQSNCSSRRGYCMSSCRDSQCRAICSDLYQSCVSSCR